MNRSAISTALLGASLTVGLGRDADLSAQRFDGDTPHWTQPWHTLKLFYPDRDRSIGRFSPAVAMPAGA